MSEGGYMAPKGDTLAIGVSPSLLFDVFLLKSLKAAKQYASFSSPKRGLGRGLGDKEGLRLCSFGVVSSTVLLFDVLA